MFAGSVESASGSLQPLTVSFPLALADRTRSIRSHASCHGHQLVADRSRTSRNMRPRRLGSWVGPPDWVRFSRRRGKRTEADLEDVRLEL